MAVEPKMYNLVAHPAYTRVHKLRLSSNSCDFELFSLTFGVYEAGPQLPVSDFPRPRYLLAISARAPRR